jgi:adenosylmethionine-8-amino-7-oxononanoate aminotransferase
VVPDLVCLAKGITGGTLPLAATLASERIFDAFLGDYAELRTFFHGHTYTGNALACAAASASLTLLLRDGGTLAGVAERAEHLGSNLERLAAHPHVGEVRRRGLMVGVEVVADKATREPYPWTERRGWQVCQEAIARGVYLRPLGDVIVLMPPLTITHAEIDRLTDTLAEALDGALG